MRKSLLHTPDGVRDIYNEECRKKLITEEKLQEVLAKYGYHMIQTPTFEFFNIFSQEIGTIPSKDLYKFFDKEGNTLVLRPDFTPSIARSAAKYYVEEEMPVKLSYSGETFINYSDYKGRLKETTQCGAELIGDASTAADAEILAMTVECLLAAGLSEFQISVGHTQFFQGLLSAAGISEEQEEELRELLSNKNFFGVEEFLAKIAMDDDLRALFGLLTNFNSSEEELLIAKEKSASYPDILASIKELDQINEYIKIYGIEKYVSFELGVISDYHYYTGIVFAGYTFGTGEPLVRGGRYDKLLSYFGKNAPAIGFAIVVDQLLAALSRQKIAIEVPNNTMLIIFTKDTRNQALAKAQSLRKEGHLVSTMLWAKDKTKEDYENYAAKNDFCSVEFI